MWEATMRRSGANEVGRGLAGYHPAVIFTYFVLVLVFSMWLMHPACLAISLICALVWSVQLGGPRALGGNLKFMVPAMLLMMLVNAAFNHQGVTILAYFSGGNPLTLESLLYGLAAAAMFLAVISWFRCYNRVMTTDKFLCLFGRAIPALSLVLSMALRFVPRFVTRAKEIARAQKGIGRDAAQGNLLQRARQGIRIVSILITWALENAVETAASMKSRGYGLPGRTAYSPFRMEERDKAALGFLLACGAYTLLMALKGEFTWYYFPAVTGRVFTPWTASALLAYLALCAMPLILDCWEERKWRSIKSST